MAIGTKEHLEEIKCNKTEPRWKQLNNIAENFVLENIPFLSLFVLIFLMICQAAMEVAEELQIDGFILFPVLLVCLILFIKIKQF